MNIQALSTFIRAPLARDVPPPIKLDYPSLLKVANKVSAEYLSNDESTANVKPTQHIQLIKTKHLSQYGIKIHSGHMRKNKFPGLDFSNTISPIRVRKGSLVLYSSDLFSNNVFSNKVIDITQYQEHFNNFKTFPSNGYYIVVINSKIRKECHKLKPILIKLNYFNRYDVIFGDRLNVLCQDSGGFTLSQANKIIEALYSPSVEEYIKNSHYVYFNKLLLSYLRVSM